MSKCSAPYRTEMLTTAYKICADEGWESAIFVLRFQIHILNLELSLCLAPKDFLHFIAALHHPHLKVITNKFARLMG